MHALVILATLGIITLLSDIIRWKKFVFPIVMIGLAAAMLTSIHEWNLSSSFFNSMMKTDNFSLAFIFLLLGISMLWFLSSKKIIENNVHSTEHYALIVFGLAGAVVMVSFSNLVMLFLGIEILSISMYVLAGSHKTRLSSNEASLKYFLMGAFSTGILLFGIALIYGATGTFNIEKIHEVLTSNGSKLPEVIIPGIIFIACGMAFKIAAFPFHFWAPDVYEGSPDIITSFMATVVKAAAIGAFFKLFFVSFSSLLVNWSETLSFIAAASILIGNITAIFQNNLKRMLAYSGIAHAGYMLLALISLDSYSSSALFYYALAYCVASLGAFTVIQLFAEKSETADISVLKGVGKKNLLASITLSACMLSLAGIPPLAGFFAKYYLFTSALNSGHTWLVLVAIAGTLISVFYYFRVIHAMFLTESKEEKLSFSLSQKIALAVVFASVIIFGIAPDLLLHNLGF